VYNSTEEKHPRISKKEKSPLYDLRLHKNVGSNRSLPKYNKELFTQDPLGRFQPSPMNPL